MKLLNKTISQKDGSGSIRLLPSTPEDLWHAYNLLQPPTDIVTSTTLRKVINTSSTGSTTSNKVRTNLSIQVHKVDFDPSSLTVRLSGPICAESKLVRLGAFHTLTLELGRAFRIEKECWDQVYLDVMQEACHPERQAEIAAVVMQPGLAHVCLVTGSLTLTQAKLEVTIPKKRTGSSNHSKAVTKFYEAVYQAILRHIDLAKIKCILLASPGYVKDDFYQYLLTQSVKRDDRPFIEHKSKFVLCKASSGHKHALEEVFADAQIMNQLTDTKFAKEVSKLNAFFRMMDTQPDQAYYGYSHVHRANEELAIDSLLLTDALFRSSEVATRQQYVQLVESVRKNGGSVFIFSSLHVSGQQLGQVSGVAAILRYPLPDLDQLELDAANYESSSEEEDSDNEEGGDNALDRVQQDVVDMGL
jgi:protein pelota